MSRVQQHQKSNPQVESLAAVVSHPLRRRIWDEITEHPISPRELADRLHEPVNDVSYHVRRLRDMGIIEPAGTRPVRGATQHFYRSIRRPHLSNEVVDLMSPEDAVANGTQVLQLEFADAAGALEAERLVARPQHYLFRLPVTLDQEGWHEFGTILAEAVDRLYEAEARCVERRSAGEEDSESIPTVVHLNLFERG